MKRRKLRTVIVALALIVGVALVGALLNLVDTQRQFSVQTIGAQTGGYDLAITKSDLAKTPMFDTAAVEKTVRGAYVQVVETFPRIQGSAEARKPGQVEGNAVTIIALNPEIDFLIRETSGNNLLLGGGRGLRIQGAGGGGRGGRAGGPPGARRIQLRGGPGGAQSSFGGGGGTGVYPPGPGQVYLDSATAGAVGVSVGDEVTLSYVMPTARESGKEATTNVSTARNEATFIVSGIGTLSGVGTDAQNPAIINLADAQKWLHVPDQAERLLVVWKNDTSTGSDAKATVTQARSVGERIRDTVQNTLGPDYKVSLPKYLTLENAAQGFIFAQTFITLYGLLSMGIVGLMVNALMNTTVTEQKHDLAVLRVLGSPRGRLYEAVIIEVVVLGSIGLVVGILLGRVINDYIITPILLATLDLPVAVQPEWSLQAVLTPTLITVLVLALATISPARAAATTKVMIVLNPAAADQPTLDDLAKLRERRANYNFLVVGLVLIAFCSVILIVLPVVFSAGNNSGIATVIFSSLLLMVIGMALVFYFITTPLERLLVSVYQVINKKAAFFAGRYALRGKGRNALISLMVVMSGVLPCLLATQLALQDANLETDARFQSGAPLTTERNTFLGGPRGNFVFRGFIAEQEKLTDKDIEAVRGQPGIANVVGIADDFRNVEVSDRIQMRSLNLSLIGVQGDLSQVLYPDLFRWSGSDTSALRLLAKDENAAIISQGLSEYLDLKVGDTIRIKGNGFDHERLLRIIATAERVPGFSNAFTRNRNDAFSSAVLVHINTYRALKNDPAKGAVDLTQGLLTKLFATIQPGVDEAEIGSALRDYLGTQNGLNVNMASERVAVQRQALSQGRIFIVLLTGLSMVTAIFGVLAVMYTAVMGRRVEIGMLKAVGAQKGALRGIFIGEAIITTLAAAVSGIIAGTLLGYVFEVTQRLQQDQPMLFAFDAGTAALIMALVCFAAIFSAALATQPVIRQKAIKILRER
jgi:ABC-type antimicrobial peptide transport system permease subunit